MSAVAQPLADLFLLPTDTLGGAERVLRLLANECAQTGMPVDVLILSRGDRGGWRGVHPGIRLHFIHADSEKTGLLPAMVALWKLGRRQRWRHVYSSHTHINAYLGVLRRIRFLRCRKLVARESTTMRDRFSSVKLALIRALYHVGYGMQDVVICQTCYMRDRLLDMVPKAKNWNLRVLPNPVDSAAIRARASGPNPLAVLGPYLLAVGRLIAVKGPELLLEAFRRIQPGHSRLRLVFVGDGPMRGQLEEQACAAGLADKVIFTGHLENPYPAMRGAELVVVASRVEGFPNTLLEAMALAPRVVSTRCAGGIEELPGVTTCTPGDAEALAVALRDALATSGGPRPDVEQELQRRTPAGYRRQILQLVGEEAG